MRFKELKHILFDYQVFICHNNDDVQKFHPTIDIIDTGEYENYNGKLFKMYGECIVKSIYVSDDGLTVDIEDEK